MEKIEYFFKQTEADSQEDIAVRNFKYKNIRFKIPVCMEEMPEEHKDIHYPYENKPPILLCNEEQTVEMTVQHMEGVTHETGLSGIMCAVHKYAEDNLDLLRICPIRYIKSRSEYIGWFLTELSLAGRIVHHRKYAMLTGKRLLLITITYPEEESIKWGGIAAKLFYSIEVEDEKNR